LKKLEDQYYWLQSYNWLFWLEMSWYTSVSLRTDCRIGFDPTCNHVRMKRFHAFAFAQEDQYWLAAALIIECFDCEMSWYILCYIRTGDCQIGFRVSNTRWSAFTILDSIGGRPVLLAKALIIVVDCENELIHPLLVYVPGLSCIDFDPSASNTWWSGQATVLWQYWWKTSIIGCSSTIE
jgi:hypothetical protein